MCEFCEQFNASKEISEENGMKINYYAILQERTVTNGKEKGILNNRSVKLVYCPSCGRNLAEENNIEMKPVIHTHAIIDWLGDCKCSNCRRAVALIIKNHRLAPLGFMCLDSGKSGKEILSEMQIGRYCKYIPDYQPERLSKLFYGDKG